MLSNLIEGEVWYPCCHLFFFFFLLWDLRKVTYLHSPPQMQEWKHSKLLSSVISEVPPCTLILSFFPSRGVRVKVHIMGTKNIVSCVVLWWLQGHLLTSQTLSRTQSKLSGCQWQGQCQGRAVPAQLWPLPSPFKFNSGEWEVGIHFYFWSASCWLWFFR